MISIKNEHKSENNMGGGEDIGIGSLIG